MAQVKPQQPQQATRVRAMTHDAVMHFYMHAFDASVHTMAHWTEFMQRCGVESMGHAITRDATERARDHMLYHRAIIFPQQSVMAETSSSSPHPRRPQPALVPTPAAVVTAASDCVSHARDSNGQPNLHRDTTFRVSPCRFYHGPMRACNWGLQCRFIHRDFWVAGPGVGDFQLHMPDVFAGQSQVLHLSVPERDARRRAVLSAIVDSIRNQANHTLYGPCIRAESH